MNREALLYFIAAALFAASGSIDLVQGEAFDLGSGLAFFAAALFVLVGVRKLRAERSGG